MQLQHRALDALYISTRNGVIGYFKIHRNVSLVSLYLDRKWLHHLFSVSNKSHKPFHFRSCSVGDFSITVQPNSKRLLYIFWDGDSSAALFCFAVNEIFLLRGPENEAQVDLQSSVINFRNIVAFNSHIKVDICACIDVIGARDTKHYMRQSLWDECRRDSQRSAHWWAFLF